MENPMLAAVINNLPHLLDNPDLVQRVLDGARADLHLNGLHLAEAAAQLRDCLRAEGRLRTLLEPTEEQRIACAMLVDAGRASYRFFLKQHWLLGQLVGLAAHCLIGVCQVHFYRHVTCSADMVTQRSDILRHANS
ncbi:hypothetical protein TRIUR3_10084 [Triticum urartu]|uniref:Uncharacterized protein n=1 Tax=Triticum urartu TaxID=4572 RepID=M7ZEB9_TRIUA|nr:hypothetical protein TRIUR3_10084 [Triticum urartu]